ncbi:MAG: 1-deoxy-D-xylulose 5-phosphate reductoisomerase [Pseudonocardiales bacterium]|nr:1-deoxy-D-xylulose 5-phosphate reductoisomerase [Pseudonocardiales bacterium]
MVNEPSRVVILGSTGSIGTQALDVIRGSAGRFVVEALCAGGSDLDAFAAQILEFRPRVVGVSRPVAGELRQRLAAKWRTKEALPEIVDGPAAAAELAQRDCEVVLNGVAGHQGLRATLAALDAGRTVALANKESLIAGGPLVLDRAKPGQLVPVDSEHSALAQCLRGGRAEEVRKLILTASGGPFRGWSRAQLADVTPEQAMAHPTWAMGPLITINSATLVNKGLEVIETNLLFSTPYERIDVVVHPQSIVHSMVEFIDGATLAQASPPDMRLPIALALAWPDRLPDVARAVDWSTAATWTFEPLDNDAFGAVRLARTAGAAGGCAPAVFNAANEDLVAAFTSGRCSFLAITDTIEEVLSGWLAEQHAAAGNPGTVEDVEFAQEWARERARKLIAAR